jgi:hypothetical protein
MTSHATAAHLHAASLQLLQQVLGAGLPRAAAQLRLGQHLLLEQGLHRSGGRLLQVRLRGVQLLLLALLGGHGRLLQGEEAREARGLRVLLGALRISRQASAAASRLHADRSSPARAWSRESLRKDRLATRSRGSSSASPNRWLGEKPGGGCTGDPCRCGASSGPPAASPAVGWALAAACSCALGWGAATCARARHHTHAYNM